MTARGAWVCASGGRPDCIARTSHVRFQPASHRPATRWLALTVALTSGRHPEQVRGGGHGQGENQNGDRENGPCHGSAPRHGNACHCLATRSRVAVQPTPACGRDAAPRRWCWACMLQGDAAAVLVVRDVAVRAKWAPRHPVSTDHPVPTLVPARGAHQPAPTATAITSASRTRTLPVPSPTQPSA